MNGKRQIQSYQLLFNKFGAPCKYLKPLGCKTIWMQIGIKNQRAAKEAKKHDLNVIMNKCPKIEYQRLFGELRVAGFNTGIISSKIDL